MTPTQKATKAPAATSAKGFTAEEKAAMKERARELKAAAENADGEKDLLSKVAEMPPADRTLAERIHKIVKSTAPGLSSKTWYGMPAYTKDGNVVFFFKPASKFKSRYATLGFSDRASLDDGDMWPSEFALMKMTPTTEKRIAALVKQAIS